MFKNKAKTYEFLTLFTMVIGTVIGSGIFVKNSQLLNQTGNPIIAIVLWIVVGIVAVMTVYAFLQIASATRHQGNGTVSNWTKLFIGRRLGSFFSTVYTYLYFPICQGVFISSFVTFLLLAIGKDINVQMQLLIFLLVGVGLIITVALTNAFSDKASKGIQIFGTIFKFIPLIICLIAGFCLIDTTAGASGSSAIWNGTGVGEGDHPWSASDFQLGLFVRGFGPILFAFDGFIYVANAQKTVKNKEIVPKALLAGMIFVAIFYILMAVSLFLGSPDGSIVALLGKIFSSSAQAANIISNVILVIISFIGANIFGFLGMRDLESNIDAKLIFNGAKPISQKRASLWQASLAIVVYVIFTLLGALISRNGWDGINATKGDLPIAKWLALSTNNITGFIGSMSSTASVLGFTMIATLIVGAVVSDFTNKVSVVRTKGFRPIAIISASLLYLIVIAGLYAFIQPTDVFTGHTPWNQSDGMYFTIFLAIAFLIILMAWGIQEWLFKKYPFKHGFNGYLINEPIDLIPPIHLHEPKTTKKSNSKAK